MSKLVQSRDFSFTECAEIDQAGQKKFEEEMEAVRRGDATWRVDSSPMDDYSHRARIPARFTNLMTVIVQQIGFSESNTGLDLAAGSTPQALRDLLCMGVLGQALAVNYHDLRPRKVKRQPELDLITGDLTEPHVWEKMATWQEECVPEGFALTMFRPMGALTDLPAEFYRGGLHTALDMGRPGGLMFTQVPTSLANVPYDLEQICLSVQERDDVTDVIVSDPPSDGARTDDAHAYAVILK